VYILAASEASELPTEPQDNILAAYTRFIQTIYLSCLLVSENTNNISNQNSKCQSIYSRRKGSNSDVAPREEKHKQDSETGARRLRGMFWKASTVKMTSSY
jgi:hypothetical protein